MSFIFDNLFSIIVFIVIISQVMGAISKQNQKKPPVRKPPAAGTTQVGRASRGATQAPPSASGDFQKRLEEARRRVQEAIEEQAGPEERPLTRAPASTLSPTQPPPPLIMPPPEDPYTLDNPQPYAFDNPQPYSLEGQSLEGESLETFGRTGHGLEGQSLEGKSLEGRSLEGLSLEGQSLEGMSLEYTPQVERLRRTPKSKALNQATKPSARGAESLVSLHPDRVISGIIWHQILSQPKSKKALARFSRRPPSVRQSR